MTHQEFDVFKELGNTSTLAMLLKKAFELRVPTATSIRGGINLSHLPFPYIMVHGHAELDDRLDRHISSRPFAIDCDLDNVSRVFESVSEDTSDDRMLNGSVLRIIWLDIRVWEAE